MKQGKTRFFLAAATKNCHANMLDLNALKVSLDPGMTEVVDSAEDSDVIVVNTCGVFKNYEDNSMRIVSDYQHRFPRKKVVLSGCLTSINPKRVTKEFSGPAIGVGEWDRLNSILSPGLVRASDISSGTPLQQPEVQIQRGPAVVRMMRVIAPHFYRFQRALGREIQPINNFIQNFVVDRATYGVLIGQGCTGQCKFCAIKFAKGRLESKPLSQIIEDIRRALGRGYKRFNLVSDDAGSWGQDLGSDLSVLLGAILALPGDFTVYVYYLDPTWLVRLFGKLKPLLADSRVTTITVPLQAASDPLLAAMGRNYRITEVYKCISEIRMLNPNLILRTHLMVGFPGESLSDVLRAVQSLCYFHMIGVFPYSERPGTAAVKLAGKVPRYSLFTRLAFLKLFASMRHIYVVASFLAAALKPWSLKGVKA